MNNTLNLAHVPREVSFILELLKEGNEQYIQQNKEALCKDIDWDHFLELTIHHRVFPLLHSKIKMLGENLLPCFVTHFLNQHYKNNTFRMLHLSAEMEQVSMLFAEHQIRTLFLKGPVLAQDLYGDISLRTSTDLDVLIPIQNLLQSEELLINLGYEKEGDYIKPLLNEWKWRDHHVAYFHPHKRIKLEIHWKLHPGPGRESSFQELWDRKRKSLLTGSPIYSLGKEDLFLFLVSHGARHGWARLRWLVDIQQMMKQKMDWKKIYMLFKKYHNPYVGGQAIILVSQLLNTKITEEMKPLLLGSSPQKLAQEAIFFLEKMVNLHTAPVPEEVSKYHKRHVFSLMSTQRKFLFLISFLHPSPHDAEILPLPRPLYFLYFPLRPLLWAWRKLRKPVWS